MIYQSATSHGLGTRFRTFALANIWGGMTLSGPNDCRGSTKDARTYECKVNERWPDEEGGGSSSPFPLSCTRWLQK